MKLSFSGWLTRTWENPPDADYSTGYDCLDEILGGGWRKQHLTIVGGRPSAGKTTLALNLLDRMVEQGIPSGMFSIERPGTEMTTKFCKLRSGGDPRPDEMRDELVTLPLWIDDRAAITPEYIRSVLEDDPVDFLVIDYLQLMSVEQRQNTRNAEIDTICQGLQAIHKDFEIQMVLLSQLNRGLESRRWEERIHGDGVGDVRPELQDLRDSGAIEQTADEVIFMYRPDQYRDYKRGDGITELIVAKNRLGPTGTVTLTFIPEEELFYE